MNSIRINKKLIRNLVQQIELGNSKETFSLISRHLELFNSAELSYLAFLSIQLPMLRQPLLELLFCSEKLDTLKPKAIKKLLCVEYFKTEFYFNESQRLQMYLNKFFSLIPEGKQYSKLFLDYVKILCALKKIEIISSFVKSKMFVKLRETVSCKYFLKLILTLSALSYQEKQDIIPNKINFSKEEVVLLRSQLNALNLPSAEKQAYQNFVINKICKCNSILEKPNEQHLFSGIDVFIASLQKANLFISCEQIDRLSTHHLSNFLSNPRPQEFKAVSTLLLYLLKLKKIKILTYFLKNVSSEIILNKKFEKTLSKLYYLSSVEHAVYGVDLRGIWGSIMERKSEAL